MRLWLIRHGETQHNIERVFQGQLDTPLTERGIQQAQQTADALEAVQFDQIYASDLARARDTARPLSAVRGTSIELDHRLREMHYGVLQGVAYTDFHSVLREHGVAEGWGNGVFSRGGEAPPGGESLAAFVDRISAFLQEFHDEAECEGEESRNLAIVAHGGTIRTIMTLLLGLPPERRTAFVLSNCGVTRFGREGATWQLEFHNRVFWADDLLTAAENV